MQLNPYTMLGNLGSQVSAVVAQGVDFTPQPGAFSVPASRSYNTGIDGFYPQNPASQAYGGGFNSYNFGSFENNYYPPGPMSGFGGTSFQPQPMNYFNQPAAMPGFSPGYQSGMPFMPPQAPPTMPAINPAQIANRALSYASNQINNAFQSTYRDFNQPDWNFMQRTGGQFTTYAPPLPPPPSPMPYYGSASFAPQQYTGFGSPATARFADTVMPPAYGPMSGFGMAPYGPDPSFYQGYGYGAPPPLPPMPPPPPPPSFLYPPATTLGYGASMFPQSPMMNAGFGAMMSPGYESFAPMGYGYNDMMPTGYGFGGAASLGYGTGYSGGFGYGGGSPYGGSSTGSRLAAINFRNATSGLNNAFNSGPSPFVGSSGFGDYDF